MKNIMFDVAASIKTEKEFEQLSLGELIAAIQRRLAQIIEDNEIEAFGFCDSYDED